MQSLRRIFTEAVIVAFAMVVLALAFNTLRHDGLPLVARTSYEVLVPCPEPGGDITPVTVDDPIIRSPHTFLIDARPSIPYAHAHLPGAISVPYDWLDPLPDTSMVQLAREIASSRATRVVVYGDGERPDSGEHLGREISGRGIKNVSFVRGGAPVLSLEGKP